ncbi:DNA binding protein [Streptomyces phage Triumph]|nr:DNA binding protein [Streptomyces phage Triumph]
MAGGYDRATVERTLPAVFDSGFAYGMKNELAPDADMPKGHVDKKKGSNFGAHLADVRRAWDAGPLSLVEKQALFLHYALDEHDEKIAAFQEVTDRAVRYRIERGVGKLAAHLNGDKYIDGYDQLEDEQ